MKALIKTARENNYQMRILESVEDVNDDQKAVLFSKLTSSMGKDLSGKTFGMWGLSFKPNTDDMREAPSLVLIDKILEAGGKIMAYDPVASHEAKRILGDKITYVNEPYEALSQADAMLVVTEWAEFKVPDFNKISTLLNNKIIFDGRNLYDKKEMNELGYEYHCIG